MNTKSIFIFYFIVSICFVLVGELIYLNKEYTLVQKDIQKKKTFVNTLALPDIAFCSETMYIRHRSLSDVFSIYKDDPNLREYSLNSYIYSNPNIKKEKQ